MRSSHYSHLVDKRIMEAVLRSRIEEAEALSNEPQAERPIITFSRESWALGDEVLEALMHLLPDNWKSWDKEILNTIATQAGERVDDVFRVDETSSSQISSTMRHLMGIGDMDPLKYRKYLMRTIRVIANEGYSVIVGRGANFVLPNSLNVRIVSRFESRVQRCVSMTSVSERQASRQISERDRLREGFIKRIYHRDIHDVNAYDVIYSTDHLEPDTIAVSIRDMASHLWGVLKP